MSKFIQLMSVVWKLDQSIQIAEIVSTDKLFLFLFFTLVITEKIRSTSAFEWGREKNSFN